MKHFEILRKTFFTMKDSQVSPYFLNDLFLTFLENYFLSTPLWNEKLFRKLPSFKPSFNEETFEV